MEALWFWIYKKNLNCDNSNIDFFSLCNSEFTDNQNKNNLNCEILLYIMLQINII